VCVWVVVCRYVEPFCVCVSVWVDLWLYMCVCVWGWDCGCAVWSLVVCSVGSVLAVKFRIYCGAGTKAPRPTINAESTS